MNKIHLLGFTVVLTAFLFLSNAFAQDYTQWRLPIGAKARYGKGWINDIKFSPLGDTVSVATTIGVWTYDVHTGKAINLFTGAMSGANAIAYTSDGSTLAAAHWDRTVCLWNVKDFLPTDPDFIFTGHPGPIYAVAISPNSRMVASGGADETSRTDTEPGGLIKVWDLGTRELRPILRYNAPVSTIAFSPNSRWIAGGSGDGTIRVWDAGTGKLIHEFKEHTESIWKLDFSPDNKWLLSISLGGTGLLRNLTNPHERPSTFRQQGTTIYAANFFPDDKDDGYNFVTGSSDKRIQLWHTNTINNKDELSPSNRVLEGHNDSIWILAFSKDGQNLASGSLDGTVRLWDMDLWSQRIKIAGHTGGIKALAYTEDHRILACGAGLDGILRLWDAGTSSQLSILFDHAGVNKVVTFSSDGRTLASSGNEDRAIFLSDVTKILDSNLDNSNFLHSLKGNRDGITALALSSPIRDPRLPAVPTKLTSGGRDARIHLLNVASGTELTTFTGAESTITALTFDPDSKSLFSGEANGIVRMWNANTGIEQFNFRSSFNAITALAFSPFPRFLAIGDEMGKIQLVDIAEDREKPIVTQHTRKITSLVFAEDGNTLFSGSEDGTILLWDIKAILSQTR
ncbi:MAG: WD40 repeat domain-containing protein [Candidatus Poribacteria bacterium]|nr:WD40 repeat domain-containing protein [Candidatus Poribacteria bacterium]